MAPKRALLTMIPHKLEVFSFDDAGKRVRCILSTFYLSYLILHNFPSSLPRFKTYIL